MVSRFMSVKDKDVRTVLQALAVKVWSQKQNGRHVFAVNRKIAKDGFGCHILIAVNIEVSNDLPSRCAVAVNDWIS